MEMCNNQGNCMSSTDNLGQNSTIVESATGCRWKEGKKGKKLQRRGPATKQNIKNSVETTVLQHC